MDPFKIEITGFQLRLLIARRVGELEEERIEVRERYVLEEKWYAERHDAASQEPGLTPAALGKLADRAIRRSISSLTTVADLLKQEEPYFVTLGDLAILGIVGH